MQVDALVVVPLPLGRANAVANEDDVAGCRDVRFGSFRPRDECVAIWETIRRAPRFAPGKGGLGCHSHQRDRLEVRSIRAGGLESQSLELGGDVFRRQAATARRRGTTLEQVARQETQMRIHGGRVDGDGGRSLRHAGGRS